MLKGNRFYNVLVHFQSVATLAMLLKWLFISVLVAIGVGSASALFLHALHDATIFRENHIWVVALLPIGGLLIGMMYYYLSPESEKGNNYVIEEIQQQKKAIPFWMAPLVFIGTVGTHFFGGSAGREGTAVQMGATIADQLHRVFKLNKRDRQILLISGVAAGFASVFATPVAGVIFAIEMAVVGRSKYDALLPAMMSAFLAEYVTNWWGAPHTHYDVHNILTFDLVNMLWVVLASIAFGFAGRLFSLGTVFFSKIFSKLSSYAPLKPFYGGVVVALLALAFGTTRYLGLGVPVIVEAFHVQVSPADFILKILFTAITLGAGYKGGEVTPLFFIGATLGSALSMYLPIPNDVLAAIGFVAVFAAAANTPISCVFMAVELFGSGNLAFYALGCVVAFMFSGHTSIYKAQILGTLKSPRHKSHRNKKFGDL